MKFPMHTLAFRTLTTALCGAFLAACGGGSAEEQAASMSADGARTLGIFSGRSVTSTQPSTSPNTTPNTTPSTTAPAVTGTVTNVRFENTSTTVQTNVPVSFGQVFAPGHLTTAMSLTGRLDNGATLPLQIDVKATHPDGSIRHAVISGLIPSLAAGTTATMELMRGGAVAATAGVTAAQLLSSGFTASTTAVIGGVRYQASADELIKSGKVTTWLSGGNVGEFQVSAPLKTSAGVQHPHLTARFAVRWYPAAKKARVDVTLENNWAYEAAPRNLIYDAEVMTGGKVVYSKAAVTHYHHARWRKVFWWGGEPQVHVKHNTAYLIDSRALPNYDRKLVIPEATLAALSTRWSKTYTDVMGIGLGTSYMPQTGGRDDIGMLPAWASMYLLSMDKRAAKATMGTADLAGSWSSHYRDKKTDQPVSLIDYPYMTIVGQAGDTYNPATKMRESFPACATATECKTPLTHDVSHQPAYAYMPYLLTGDHYYLEELQFWGMYNVFASNPGYRENIKGLLKPEQVRGQAWSLRTLAEAAYITPDKDRLKEHFNRILASNLAWYNKEYTDNAAANKLGVVVNGYALGYANGTGVAPWMDDFFTAAVGHAHDLGYSEATRLLKWKAQFPISRMVGQGACYISGAMYAMIIRDSATSPFYTTIGQAFKTTTPVAVASTQCGSAAMASALGLKTGEMTGYSAAYAGYPSNMQPALAYSADVGGDTGAKAWSVFMSRSVKPDYSQGPQFNIVPR